eukprot:6465724-Amphidinium_carterae.3
MAASWAWNQACSRSYRRLRSRMTSGSIYRVWAAWQKPRILSWRDCCIFRGETPVGRGALDEAFTLAHQAERPTLEGEPFAAVFLDCSKCYERVDLTFLEESAREAGFPLQALRLAIDMYRGRRRTLVNGAISEPVEASLIPASQLRVSVRKYVDDMVLSASGKGCAYDLREAFRAIKRVLEASGMRLNKTKCVVVANTNACRLECRKAWHRMGVDVSFTTRDLGVDVQWGPWRNPVQQARIVSFNKAMKR